MTDSHSGMKNRGIRFTASGKIDFSGQPSLRGKGYDLVNSSFSVVVPYPTDNFNVGVYITAAVWLNNTIGVDNWYAANSSFYFKNNEDAVQFKLRFL